MDEGFDSDVFLEPDFYSSNTLVAKVMFLFVLLEPCLAPKGERQGQGLIFQLGKNSCSRIRLKLELLSWLPCPSARKTRSVVLTCSLWLPPRDLSAMQPGWKERSSEQ